VAGGPPEPLRPFRTRSIGYIGASVLLGRRTPTYWYNPKTQTSERVADPSDDEEAIRMLAGHPDSATLVSEYAKLRRSDTPIERALVSVGHEERLRQHAYMLVWLPERDRPGRRTRPSTTGYELLLAVRLLEVGRDRQRGRRS
jgi:hypothetical protein